MKTDDPNENYYSLTNTFIDIVTKYAPLKKKFIRENKAPFMTTELRIEICTKRRFRNKYCKTLLKKIKKLYKNRETNALPLEKMYERILSQHN